MTVTTDGAVPPSPSAGAPRAPRHDEVREHHGDRFVDPYAWLRDVEHPETLPHLRAENAWTEAATAHLAPLRDQIFEEIRSRTMEDDSSVPVRDGDWWYYVRTETDRSYRIHCRRRDDGTGTAPTGDEEIVLDVNLLVEDDGYIGIGVLDVSPDGNILAYAVDRSGDERHVLGFRDLRTGEDLAESISDVGYGFAWAADSRTCWYVVLDAASRPHRIIRHGLGSDPSIDVEVFREDDESFHASVGTSRSLAVAVIGSESAVTSEAWLLDASDPLADPVVVVPRVHGVEYSLDHHPSGLMVVSNHDGAEGFALWRAPLDGTRTAPRSEWELLVPHRDGTRLDGVEAFADHLMLHGRTDGTTAIWQLAPTGGELRRLEPPEPAATIGPGANATFETDRYRFGYQSLATPASILDEDLRSGERVLLRRHPVLGGFDPDGYETAREWALADDGTRIPVSLVWRRDAVPVGEPAPLVLYGYGAYEASMDPWFSVARLSLLDRGAVFAVAHIRGGGELGRAWYEGGKFGHKHRTFDDFVAVARHLVATGRTAPDRLAARGGSAGGLLMGAAVNLAPDLFKAVVAEVGFLDPLNTMLDPSLPLTVIEWEEWGNPLEDPVAYDWIRSYSPYENVADGAPQPAILATAGISDPRVGFHEPTKWIARLRDAAEAAATVGTFDAADSSGPAGSGTAANTTLLRVELDSGHGGPSGRYASWRDEAFILAFLLDQLGIA